MTQDDVYKIVECAINEHPLDCKCRICTAFTDAPDGSRGHAAACNAHEYAHGYSPMTSIFDLIAAASAELEGK